MRRLTIPFLLAASLALHGCGNTCQDLGDRLCQCSGSGSARTSCKTEVKNQLSAAGVDSTDEAICSAMLNTCNAPAGASFCEWTNTACGKASCGLSNEPVAAACVP